jgi:DNA-binding transcriptional LysR family regulator
MLHAETEGLGLSYLIDSSVRAHVADKRLLRVLEAYCVPFPGFFLYYPSRAHVAPKLKALVDFYKLERARPLPKRARG